MEVKPTKGNKENVSGGLNKTKTTGKIEKDIIPAKDKSPDDMEIFEQSDPGIAPWNFGIDVIASGPACERWSFFIEN